MILNAKIGGFMVFMAIFACESLYHSQGGHAADAIRAYGRCVLWSRWAESKWYAIFETI